jgi:hypothetical protein
MAERGDPSVFLSYAEEDSAVAREIAQQLSDQGLRVFIWEDPQYQGRFIKRIEEEITHADAFVALLSPSYLASTWCRMERELALQREQDLQASGSSETFLYVLRIAAVRHQGVGFLRAYNWIEATSAELRRGALPPLADSLRLLERPAESNLTEAPDLVSALPMFWNRTDELRRVTEGVQSVAGPHFWLVLAPPQLGKTWFLVRVIRDVLATEPEDWDAQLIDLRLQPPEVRGDVCALLGLLFGLDGAAQASHGALMKIAQGISRSRKSALCLLDSAELLDTKTARALRGCLSEIYRLVQSVGRVGVRLAVIVASRQEGAWRGVSPQPRLRPLPLTEFPEHVTRAVLQEMAGEMDVHFNPAEHERHVALVHGLSEGLPGLLVRCLQWIRAEEWMDMDRLAGPEAFADIVHPYINAQLLSAESLVPWDDDRPDQPGPGDPRPVLVEALRVLVPYRLFTQSHLRQYLDSDPALRAALAAQGWSLTDLWQAISATALLLRPLNEPWQEIHGAIRRLIYRYFYEPGEQRAQAHREACAFVKIWADQQWGKEQVIGLVESLWHEAMALRLAQSGEQAGAMAAEILPGSARVLSRALRESEAYTVAELREYAAERMLIDDEFQASVSGVPGLAGRLADIVLTPQES